MGAGHYWETPEGRRRRRESQKAGDVLWDLSIGAFIDSAKEVNKQQKALKKKQQQDKKKGWFS